MGILVEGFLAEADVLDGSCVRIAYELDKSIDPKPTHLKPPNSLTENHEIASVAGLRYLRDQPANSARLTRPDSLNTHTRPFLIENLGN